MLGTLAGDRLELEEVTRFPNRMLRLGGHLYWNIYSLYEHLKEGLAVVARKGVPVTSIGIDTWGVDFVCVAPDGTFLGLPFAYRDPHTVGQKESFFREVMPADALYTRTGIQHLDFNTIFQLYTLKRHNNFALSQASGLLFIPDALSYMLTGNKVTEYTIASTSGLLNPATRRFDASLLNMLGIDASLFPPLVEPGTVIGGLSKDICEALQLPSIPVIAVAGHDTASAVAAVPAGDENFAYLSSGTWSLMGIETSKPVINEKTSAFNITNEGGVDGTIRLLKNITGMWIVEQCLAEWRKAGVEYTYPQMVELAMEARPFLCFINPDDEAFANPHCMPEAICAYCRRTEQACPQTHGEFIRVIFESLALRYREVLDVFRGLASKPVSRLHIIGGGSRNRLLNQFTANAIGLPVVAGPGEASSIGNIMLQAKAAGVVSSLKEMRRIISTHIKLEYLRRKTFGVMPMTTIYQSLKNKSYERTKHFERLRKCTRALCRFRRGYRQGAGDHAKFSSVFALLAGG